MTRRRTSIFALGICIGTFLLLFGDTFAEEASSTTAPEKFDSQVASTPHRISTTILTRVSPTHPSQLIREEDKRNVEPTSREVEGRENDGLNRNDSGDESRFKGKNDASVSRNDTQATSRAGGSVDEIESLSSADGSRKPRYGEISAENSGKSTSTKTVSEGPPLRLSRTNELTLPTTKPALNDSKQDNKKNLGNATLEESHDHEGRSDAIETAPTSTREKLIDEKSATSSEKNPEADVKVTFKNRTLPEDSISESKRNPNTAGTMAAGNVSSAAPKPTNEDVVRLDERKDKVSKFDPKEVVPKIESKKNSKNNTALGNLTDRGNTEDQLLESRERESTTMRGARLEHASESKKDLADPATTASEAFDLEKIEGKGQDGTVSLINDTSVNYKTQTEKEPRDGTDDQSADVEGSRGNGDPKKEVEVVENVTHQPILKIIAVANDSAANDSHVNELGVSQTKAAYNKNVETMGDAEKRKSIGPPEAQVKLLETTTVRPEEQSSSTSKVIPSPIPQGRTIGFSGVNEFPSIEVKSTAATKTDGVSEAESVFRSIITLTQKPYPYMKSAIGPFIMTTEASLKPNNSNNSEAYENTIAKGESEKKLVVTEASVVIENSIQQQKPEEKSLNESANSTTESSSVTVIPVTQGEISPTNETTPDKMVSGLKSAETTKEPRSRESNAPITKSEGQAIAAGRDEGYDVTGNGITEVSLPPEASGRGDGKEMKSRPNEATESSMSRPKESPTTTSKVASFNTDIQMDPEEAMMIRSTLVVTESTIVPLDKDIATEANKSTTTSMTPSTEKVAVENTTESTSNTNVTLQLPPSNASQSAELSPPTTLDPDESSVPTTTSIEFEFVGLTETTSLNVTNGTTGRTFEEPSRFTIPLTISDSTTKDASTEEATTTTRAEESTEFPVENETSTTDQATMNGTTDGRASSAVTRPTIDERNNRTETTGTKLTTSEIDFTDAVTEDPSTSKDSSFSENVTETSAPGIATPPATNVSKSPSAPFVPTSTLLPKVLTPNITESPEVEVTKSIQTLSQDEITSLVKIIIEGTSQEICPHLSDLQSALADALRNTDKLVSPKQIKIHQSPCNEPISSSPTSLDVPLTSISVYVVDENGKFDDAMTKLLLTLHNVSRNFPVRIRKFVLVQETDSGNAIAVVVVSSVAFICLVLLAGLLFIMRKRQTRFNYGERCRPVSLDAYSLDSVSAYSSVRRKVTSRTSKRSYGNPTFEDSSAIPSHPLNFSGILSFCNDVNAINEEFSNIPQVSVKIDELPPDAEVKNRYANVIPLPETRVPLERLNNDATTEYINASYVRGPKNATKYYIACQAPLDSTVTDFWRMIWEQQCKVIIMLTDLVENGVEKCTEYIPPSEVTDCHRLYGDFQVTLKKRETKEKYAISTLHLKNLENNTFREVFHIWYLWPVSGVESDGAGLIAVLLEARALQRGGPGPIVVHCSSGTGRTGTLIALDLGIRQYEITRTVDVPRVVYTIRRDRAGAVQTREQYAFIYKALNLYATKLAGGVLEST